MALFHRLLFKIIFFVVVLFTLSFGLYLIFFIQSELRRETETIRSHGFAFAELSAPLLYQDYLTASARGFPRFQDIAADRLENDSNITEVMLIATNGKIIFDSLDFASDVVSGRTGGTTGERFIDDAGTKQLLQQETIQSRPFVQEKEKFTEIVVPLTEIGGGHVFSMRYLLSYRSLDNRTVEIYRETFFAFLPLVLLTVGSGIFLAFSITKPIESLSHATEKFAHGDLSVRLPVKSQDEIGRLTNAFNQMVTTISGSQQKLRDYSLLLEKEVAQRTQELQGKVSELERLNKLMIGRELKMSELKKENEALKQKTAPPESKPSQV